jgi:hypothetical protein
LVDGERLARRYLGMEKCPKTAAPARGRLEQELVPLFAV